MRQHSKSSLKIATSAASRDGHAGIRRRIPNYANHTASVTSEPASDEKLSSSAKVFFLVSGFLVIVSLGLFFSAHHFGGDLSRAGHSNSTQELEIVVANNVLNVKENVIRFPKQRQAGVHDRIELYLHWPTLSGYTDELGDVFNNSGNMEELVFLSIEPRTMSFDMSGRLEPIYSLYFDGLAVEDRTGLIRQPLSESGGFIDEDMFYEANSPYPFTVRCVREISKIGTPMCMRDIHIGTDLMVTYRFNKRFLKDWMKLDQSVRAYAKDLLSGKSLAMAN